MPPRGDATTVRSTLNPRRPGSSRISGRTDGDIIVHVDLPEDRQKAVEALVGTVRQRITEARTPSLVGEPWTTPDPASRPASAGRGRKPLCP